MLGDPSSPTQQGIIPRATTDLFASIEQLRAEEMARPGVIEVRAEVKASCELSAAGEGRPSGGKEISISHLLPLILRRRDLPGAAL
jgi:hypothetical protein